MKYKYCQAYTNLKALLGTEDRDLIDLMLGLLEIDPEERLTAKEALFHPFFGQLMPFELSIGSGNGMIDGYYGLVLILFFFLFFR